MAKRLSKKQRQDIFIKSYLKTRYITGSCDKIGISRQTYYKWLNEDPKFVEKLENAKQSHNDLCENKILGWVEKGDKEMLKFWSMHHMKDRGYNDKQQIELLGGSNKIDVNIIPPSKQAKYSEEDIEKIIQERLKE